MVQRVTVTIPDELGERLNAVKQHLNVSRVCAEAIEVAVIKQECFMTEPKDMDKIVERLKVERKQVIEAMLALGRQEGFETAQSMQYTDIMQVVRVVESAKEDEWGDITEAPLWQDWLCESVQETARWEGGSFDQEVYLEGWIQGVMKFWQEVRHRV